MSREIKFRAWEARVEKYIDWENFINNPFGTWGMKAFNNDRYHFQQYTGLKDKDGKEIYEGDILKCKCWDKRKSSIDGFDPLGETLYFYRNSVIEWWHSHCNLGYRLRDGKGKTLMIKPSSLNAMEVEVIGNIYEHKHLLEETA
ncbi:YopX family protein [Lysinibacillus capsici]|uniref:YopX family protein n=1 Tax=Lysinibacillus capsici TaxID=2115968 RepID=UPI0034E5302A